MKAKRISKHGPLFFVVVIIILVGPGGGAQALAAPDNQTNAPVAGYSRVIAGEIPISATDSATPSDGPQTSAAGAGLNIVPTFDASIDAATQAVINTAVAFYNNTFSTNITVNIYFYNMGSGLGQSTFFVFSTTYANWRTHLGTVSSSADDTTALANTQTGTDPISGSGANIGLKSPSCRAVGISCSEGLFNGSPCPGFTGSGCIGLNVALANAHGDLLAVVEHEMDEVLGLGSALNGTTTPATPWPEDLFRWASAGTRSYAANTSSSVPCSVATPHAFFSIDGGATSPNEFNNCNNGGDYGDWITHTPSQVQDAFTNFSGTPSLTSTSDEVRALDVIGYTIATPKKARSQLVSE